MGRKERGRREARDTRSGRVAYAAESWVPGRITSYKVGEVAVILKEGESVARVAGDVLWRAAKGDKGSTDGTGVNDGRMCEETACTEEVLFRTGVENGD